jgi:antirestriction protein ArdC
MTNVSKVDSAITDKFIKKVTESGYLPWQRPWEMIDNQNFESKHVYTGCNRWMTALSDFACPYWTSFNKIKAHGGHVLKGSEATPIIFLGGGTAKDKFKENGDNQTYRFLRYYSVFNVEQTSLEVPANEESKLALLDVHQFLNTGHMPSVKHGDARAFYSPSQDKIHLPYLDTFSTEDAYFSTLFHELIHATGHHTRLDRTAIFSEADMAKESYSFEELVAEIGSALLCKLTGRFSKDVEDNAIAYLNGWKSRLSSNQDWLISASSKAEKAVNYLIGKDDSYVKSD